MKAICLSHRPAIESLILLYPYSTPVLTPTLKAKIKFRDLSFWQPWLWRLPTFGGMCCLHLKSRRKLKQGGTSKQWQILTRLHDVMSQKTVVLHWQMLHKVLIVIRFLRIVYSGNVAAILMSACRNLKVLYGIFRISCAMPTHNRLLNLTPLQAF